MEIKPADGATPRRRPPWERLAGGVLVLLWCGLPFAAAGTLAWPAGWTYLGVMAAALVAHRAFVAARSPALLERRARIGEGTPWWDLAWVAVFWPLMLATPVVAGLDTVRWGRAPLAPWAAAAGALLLAAGLALSARSMAANPFFEGTVRLQPGQRVVDAGPYRWVRHPGYAGLVLWALGSAPLARSGLALWPAGLAAAWVVVRTALEDRLLRRRLDGYAAYAGRVRWRLLPGVW